MSKVKGISFAQFIEHFPLVELPLTLSPESHHDFSRNNEPLSEWAIQQYILPIEETEADEYTEYVPCFRLPNTEMFHAIVYWQAGLMNYQYTLVTFQQNGALIDKRVIAGTFSDGRTLTQSVAVIDADWEITVISGRSAAQIDSHYDASASTAIQLELLPEGHIVTN